MRTSAKVILDLRGFAAFSTTRGFGTKLSFWRRPSIIRATISGKSRPLNLYAGTSLRPQPNRVEVAGAVEQRSGFVSRGRRFHKAKVLRARDASLPQRQSAHRPHP